MLTGHHPGPPPPRRRPRWPALALLTLAACRRPDPRPARALEAAPGREDEAIAAYESLCDAFPDDEVCADAQRRLARLHARAAEGLLAKGQFLAADRRLLLALSLASPAERAGLEPLRSAPRLRAGLEAERACAYAPPAAALEALEALAADGAPAADVARACLERRGDELVSQRVRLACAPRPAESCVALLRYAPRLERSGDAEHQALVAQMRREQKRLAPLRQKAESRLRRIAQINRQLHDREEAIEECVSRLSLDDQPHGRPAEIRLTCEESRGVPPDFQLREDLEALLMDTLDQIADPGLTASLLARLASAREGVHSPEPTAP